VDQAFHEVAGQFPSQLPRALVVTAHPTIPLTAPCLLAVHRLHLLSQLARHEGLLSQTGGLVILAFRQNEGIPVNDFDQKVVYGRLSSDVSLAADSQSNDSRAVPSAHRQGAAPKLPSALRADCSRCAGLCCVVHAFYSVQGFAFDKPAHSACRYLTLENRCAIHTRLASRGFPGCVAFDCYGAGQRVTQELFNGMSWRTSDETAVRNLFSAYTSFLALHRLMAMLALAEATVSPPLDTQMRLKREQLNDLCRSEQAKRGSLDIATLQTDVLKLVRKELLTRSDRD
jgi:hypothetical protein